MAYLLTKASQRPLSRAEQIEIARRWIDGGRTDHRLRDVLIVTNLRLVLRFAAAYCPSTQGQDVREDLIQAAVVLASQPVHRAVGIAQEFGVTLDELRAARAVMRVPLSLDRPVGRTDPAPLGDRLGSGAASPEEVIAETEALEWLRTAIAAARMSDRARVVVEARLAGASLEEAGRLIGVTRERARQLEAAALRPLMKSLRTQARKGTE